MSKSKEETKKEETAQTTAQIETPKKTYVKPAIESESLMAFGALCNGTLSGGRKATTGAPNNCNASKLLS